jgi:hypothetical protein
VILESGTYDYYEIRAIELIQEARARIADPISNPEDAKNNKLRYDALIERSIFLLALAKLTR